MTPQDRRHLGYAQGWLGLGDWKSADAELDEIAPKNRAEPEVLLCRVEIYSKAGKWDDAATIARPLVEQLSEWPGHWRVLYALARCQAQLGNYSDAKTTLDHAMRSAPMDIRQKAPDDPAMEPLWRNIGTA